jgi:hypothetical protein
LWFDLFGVLSLRLDPFGVMSFAVQSVWGDVFCDSIRLWHFLLWCNPIGALSFAVRSVGGVVFAV